MQFWTHIGDKVAKDVIFVIKVCTANIGMIFARDFCSLNRQVEQKPGGRGRGRE